MHKYQWDLIHNPKGGLYMFQDESEGESVIADSMTVQAIVDSLRYHYQNPQTDTLRITQWANNNNLKEEVKLAFSDGFNVEFDDDIKVHCKTYVNCNEISDISKNILKKVAKGFDMPEVLISSGRRSVEDQSDAMYINCLRSGVESQYELYGTNGDAVVEIFEDTYNGENETETKQAMINKINELGGYNVSKHCGTVEEYSNYNVIDERDNGINCIHIEIKIN